MRREQALADRATARNARLVQLRAERAAWLQERAVLVASRETQQRRLTLAIQRHEEWLQRDNLLPRLRRAQRWITAFLAPPIQFLSSLPQPQRQGRGLLARML
jgi:hypothetical protein